MKTKLVQNVNRMSERQNDMTKDRLTDRQTDRKTDRRQNDFSAQLSKQKLFRMSTGCQKDRQTGKYQDRKYFSAQLLKQKLFIMSTGCHKDKKTCRQIDRQTDSECQQHVRKIERQMD